MIDNGDTKNSFAQYSNLETWFLDQSDDQFPAYQTNQGDIAYPEKYKRLKEALVPLHNIVEKGAMAESFSAWKTQMVSKMEALYEESEHSAGEIQNIQHLLETDSIVYLNQHGTGHVEKVIEKAFDLLKKFTTDPLSPTEVFLLLCAIQVHDIGNIFGRDGHERNIREATIDLIKPIIPDAATQTLIYRIAQVHSGSINGNKDTIGAANFRFDRALLGVKPIREPLIAAILRFSDELADDSSRADKQALRLKTIPEASVIYHQYSETLHSVLINENTVNQSLYLSLDYYIDSKIIATPFSKNGKEQLLIDEIFSRTIKIEQERRYCMRYLSQYLPLVEVRVRIEISSDYDLMQPEVIGYTLQENGYPSQEIAIDCIDNTGEKVIALLIGKGWKLNNVGENK